MSDYDDGRRIGAELARRELLSHARIAAGYAREALEVVADYEPASDYDRGLLDGYRAVLLAVL